MKLIKPQTALYGGYAGGEKYEVNNIVFKFAVGRFSVVKSLVKYCISFMSSCTEGRGLCHWILLWSFINALQTQKICLGMVESKQHRK